MAKATYFQRNDGSVFHTEYSHLYENDPEYKKLSQQKGMEARREYCIAELRKMIKPGQKVFCILRSVSGSGMSRVISLYIVNNGELRNIDALASDVLLYTQTNEGIRIGGCGMDMGFAMVYNLGRALFRDGFGIQGENPDGLKVTPKTKRQADNMVKRGVKFRGRNADPSGWDNDGGYALKHSWL